MFRSIARELGRRCYRGSPPLACASPLWPAVGGGTLPRRRLAVAPSVRGAPFREAAERIRTLKRLENQTLLQLYALFKQVGAAAVGAFDVSLWVEWAEFTSPQTTGE